MHAKDLVQTFWRINLTSVTSSKMTTTLWIYDLMMMMQLTVRMKRSLGSKLNFQARGNVLGLQTKTGKKSIAILGDGMIMLKRESSMHAKHHVGACDEIVSC